MCTNRKKLHHCISAIGNRAQYFLNTTSTRTLAWTKYRDARCEILDVDHTVWIGSGFEMHYLEQVGKQGFHRSMANVLE